MEIKKYLPISMKKILIDTIVENSITEDDNGLKKIDYIQKDIARVIMIVTSYTDMEISIDNYDELLERGKFNEIISEIAPSEIEFITNQVDSILEQEIKINNSIEGIIANKLDELIKKIPSEESMKGLLGEITSNEFVTQIGKILKPNRQQKRKAEKVGD